MKLNQIDMTVYAIKFMPADHYLAQDQTGAQFVRCPKLTPWPLAAMKFYREDEKDETLGLKLARQVASRWSNAHIIKMSYSVVELEEVPLTDAAAEVSLAT